MKVIKTVVSLLEKFMSILVLLAITVLFGSVLFVGFSQGIWAALGGFLVGSIFLVFAFGLPCVLIDINNNIKELNMGVLNVSKTNFQQINISSRDNEVASNNQSHQNVKKISEITDRYVGNYEVAPNRVFIIKKEGETIIAQFENDKLEKLLPKGLTSYATENNKKLITFIESNEKVKHMIIRENEEDMIAKKID